MNGDQGAVVLEFIYARCRGNSLGWEVVPMGTEPKETYPCIGFSFTAEPSQLEQGGSPISTYYSANVVCIGRAEVNDIAELRPMVRELHANLFVNNSQPGTVFGDSSILHCVENMPLTDFYRDAKGVLRWFHGTQWRVKVCPDISLR